MHVLIQLIQSLVVGLAAACLAHFGLALKEPPHPAPPAVVHRISATAPAAPARSDVPCPLERGATTA